MLCIKCAKTIFQTKPIGLPTSKQMRRMWACLFIWRACVASALTSTLAWKENCLYSFRSRSNVMLGLRDQ